MGQGGRGDTGRRGAAAGLGRVGWSRARLAGSLAGSARWVPARRSLARSRRRCLFRVRPSASVRECAGGDAGETLLFPLLLLGRSLRPPRPRPTPPGTLGSVVPAPLLDRLPREGSGDLLTSTPQPGLAMVRA